MKPLMSFVSPVYKCRDCLRKLVSEIALVCERIDVDFEIILVDDQCPDESWTEIQDLSISNHHITGLKLSRNFGQHSAIEAGLSAINGDWIVVLDCDLQDDPAAVESLWALAQSEPHADAIIAKRANRTDSRFRRLFSYAFYQTLSYLTGTKISSEVANFGLYQRKVIDAYNSWSEEQKYFPVMVQWMGFEQRTVEVPHKERFSGKSSYNFRGLMTLGARVVLSFSDRPLWLMAGLGSIIAMASILTTVIILFLALAGRFDVQGWTSLILSIWFWGGVNIAAAGLIGVYLGRTLREAKQRPSFIISRHVGAGEETDA